MNGAYHDGKPDVNSLQLSHDSNYPGFKSESLKKWSEAARQTYASLVAPGYPKQPKCGRPGKLLFTESHPDLLPCRSVDAEFFSLQVR